MNKVLIIDDDKELCTLMKKCVEQENLTAVVAGGGIEGLHILEENKNTCSLIVFAMANVLSPLSAVFRWALPHMTTGPTYGLDDWFLSSPACIGILILTAIASLTLAIIYKSKQEI